MQQRAFREENIERVQVFPYNPFWIKEYAAESEKIKEQFGHELRQIHHIGSTAIPGMNARPIIDMLLEMRDIDSSSQLEKLGYHYIGKERFFGKSGEHSFELYVYQEGDPHIARHLRFREYLRALPDEMQNYTEYKALIAREFPVDLRAYELKKSSYVHGIERKALLWKGAQPHTKISPRKRKWSETEVLNALRANRNFALSYLVHFLPHTELIIDQGIEWVYAEIPSNAFNYIIETRLSPENAAPHVAEVVTFFQRKDLPFTWWVGPGDSPRNLEEILKSMGLGCKEVQVGMALGLNHASKVESKLRFERILDRVHIFDFDEIALEHGEPVDAFDKFYEQIPKPLYQEGEPIEFYVALSEGVPVARARLVFYGDVMGIYDLLTSPHERSSAWAKEMIQFALERARVKGYEYVTILAPAEDKNICEELGFKEHARFLKYIL